MAPPLHAVAAATPPHSALSDYGLRYTDHKFGFPCGDPENGAAWKERKCNVTMQLRRQIARACNASRGQKSKRALA
jgi:hypothetical protein